MKKNIPDFISDIVSPLEDDVIRLRAVEMSDVDLLYSVENNVAEWYADDSMAPLSRELLLQYAATYDADPFRAGQLRLVAEIKKGGTPVGFLDLYDISYKNLHASVGIYILRAHRRSRLGLRSVALLERYACDILGLKSLLAKVAVSNRASDDFFRRCGYTSRGTLSEWLHRGRTFTDITLYQKVLF